MILGHHVAQYFGCTIARMLRGFPSIDETFSTREALLEVGLCTESLPKGAMFDMSRCMHFTDDWELETELDLQDLNWEDVYLDEKHSSPEGTANHRLKYAIVEDAFNEAWTAHISFGRTSPLTRAGVPAGTTGASESDPIQSRSERARHVTACVSWTGRSAPSC